MVAVFGDLIQDLAISTVLRKVDRCSDVGGETFGSANSQNIREDNQIAANQQRRSQRIGPGLQDDTFVKRKVRVCLLAQAGKTDELLDTFEWLLAFAHASSELVGRLI